jgi:hypothetical protein
MPEADAGRGRERRRWRGDAGRSALLLGLEGGLVVGLRRVRDGDACGKRSISFRVPFPYVCPEHVLVKRSL